LTAFLYDADSKDGHVSLGNVAVDHLNEQQLLWIDMSRDEDLATVAKDLALAAETVRALGEPAPEPALFMHDAYVHIVVVAPSATTPSAPQVIDCLVGRNWVLTIHPEAVEFLGRFDERIRGDSDLGKLDADAVRLLGRVAKLVEG